MKQATKHEDFPQYQNDPQEPMCVPSTTTQFSDGAVGATSWKARVIVMGMATLVAGKSLPGFSSSDELTAKVSELTMTCVK